MTTSRPEGTQQGALEGGVMISRPTFPRLGDASTSSFMIDLGLGAGGCEGGAFFDCGVLSTIGSAFGSARGLAFGSSLGSALADRALIRARTPKRRAARTTQVPIPAAFSYSLPLAALTAPKGRAYQLRLLGWSVQEGCLTRTRHRLPGIPPKSKRPVISKRAYRHSLPAVTERPRGHAARASQSI